MWEFYLKLQQFDKAKEYFNQAFIFTKKKKKKKLLQQKLNNTIIKNQQKLWTSEMGKSAGSPAAYLEVW